MRLLSFIVLFPLIFQVAFAQETRLLPQDYPSIQSALDVSNMGDDILVSPGIYYEHLVWPVNVNGIELRSTDGAETTFIDGSEDGRPLYIEGNNSISSITIIDGFTLRNGYLEGNNANGAGMYVGLSGPTLRNLIIENNTIVSNHAQGGGIYFENSFSTMENCIIRSNTLSSTSWAVGGGVYARRSNIEFLDSRFEYNQNDADNWAYGGGVYLDESNAQLIGCTINGNITRGGGWSYGAGINITSSLNEFAKVDLIGCTINNNLPLGTRRYGAAVYATHDVDVNIVNTVIHDNGPSTSTIHLEIETANIFNSTITKNKSGIRCRETDLNIRNSILWDNEFTIIDAGWNEESVINVDHSLIQGGYEGYGNIQNNPLFASANLFIPSENSPCLNTGNRDIDFNTDINNNERPYPIGSNPDIGAYEINQNFAHILSRFYFDTNTNGIQDIGEKFIGKGAINVNEETELVNSHADGIFTLVDQGNLKIGFIQQLNSLWYLTSSTEEYNFLVNEEEFADTIYFGIYPAREIKNIEAGIYSPALRCSRTITVEFMITNGGTTIEDGVLWARLDPRVSEVLPLDDTDFVDGANLGWNYTNLMPGETETKYVSLKIPGVTEIEQGERLTFIAETISNEDQDCKDDFIYEDEVRCSYDPNDKLVNPNREDQLVLHGEDITYTIRFQNVGNDYADDVLVVDTLDSNFDYSTFKMLNTSHPDQLRYSLSSDGILNFDFHEIYLPDSTRDEQGSNGYVMYSIRPDSTLVDFDVVENTAHIYFDFNPAIVTNTTKNTLVERLPSVSTFDDHLSIDVKIFPNPTSGLVQFSERMDQIELYDLRGKLILVDRNVEKVDISRNLNGTYIARLSKGVHVVFKKMVLIK